MSGELGQYDEKVNETEDLGLTAPKEIGQCAWSVLFRRHESEGVVHEESCLAISFQTIPHKTSMAVWDVPSPVTIGSSFKVKVGMQCSARCRLTGRLIEIRDEAGTKIGGGQLGETPWTGTSALYWAEVELAAPAIERTSFASLTCTTAELELPHEGASLSFSFRTDKPPEHTVTVKVIEEKTGAPVGDVEVRLGLYVASTDESGVVKVDLPKGAYELSIRKDGYKAQPMSVEVRDDLIVEVEALTAPTRAEMDEVAAQFKDYPWG